MKAFIKNLVLLFATMASLGLMQAGRVAAQTYSFGPQIQTTNTASITYNSLTGAFQYTDTANSSDDDASVPLTGNAANLITSSNGWHASVTVNVAARSMTATSAASPSDGMGVSVVYIKGENEYYVSIIPGQVNNTGDAGADFPDSVYGTGAHFLARLNGGNEVTTPLGASEYVNGDSILVVSGGSNTVAATESVGAITAVATLDYDPATKTVTGYYNGIPVASYSIAGWGSNPPLTLYVFGSSGEGINVPAGTDTATNFNAGWGTFSLPQLSIVRSGTNVILTWPTNATGFALESTTNLVSTNWAAVSPLPLVVNSNNAVTNALSGTGKFYRLSQ